MSLVFGTCGFSTPESQKTRISNVRHRRHASDEPPGTRRRASARDGDRSGAGQSSPRRRPRWVRRLYDLYAPLVHGILLARVPRAEVDDLVQDIFLHAFKKLHTLRDELAFGPWIAMIARNRAVDFHRRSRETVEINDELRGSDSTGFESQQRSWN